jgi:hypothetical protein
MDPSLDQGGIVARPATSAAAATIAAVAATAAGVGAGSTGPSVPRATPPCQPAAVLPWWAARSASGVAGRGRMPPAPGPARPRPEARLA